MLVLFETPAGYALFKLLDKKKLKNVDSLNAEFATPDSAANLVKLKAFSKFEDISKALSAATALCDGTLDENLASFLQQNLKEKAKLAVGDVKLGNLIKEELGFKCVFDDAVLELMRGIRSQLNSLVGGLSDAEHNAMKLGLAHSLSRYQLKFSPDKVDTMIIQAIALLDELDKELNTYAMRVREWYGWHFPEMGKIVVDNIMYAKTVLKMGVRTNASDTDLSDILPEDVEKEVKEAAEVSMGTEVAEIDILNIKDLCDQVISIADYRGSLFEYLKNRMNAIAPNLTVMVGELVGARLIAHAGSLINLAKHPASTVQILGAEKALFRALKTKHETPKYGLIYHASLVGQAAPKHKGKISRILAAKTSLSVRADALGDEEGVTIAYEARATVESRLREMEGSVVKAISGTGKGKASQEKYEKPSGTKRYNAAADVTVSIEANGNEAEPPTKKHKKDKKKRKAEEDAVPDEADKAEKKKKKKKRKAEADAQAEEESADASAKAEKKKKKKKKQKKSEA